MVISKKIVLLQIFFGGPVPPSPGIYGPDSMLLATLTAFLNYLDLAK